MNKVSSIKQTYKINAEDFKSSFLHRVLRNVFILLIFAVFIIADIPFVLSFWIKVILFSLVAIYLFSELIGYVKCREKIFHSYIELYEDHLCFCFGEKNNTLSYKDVKGMDLKKSSSSIKYMRLTTKFGYKVKLKNFENIDLMYAFLQKKIAGNK